MHETQATNILLLSVNLIIIFLTNQFIMWYKMQENGKKKKRKST